MCDKIRFECLKQVLINCKTESRKDNLMHNFKKHWISMSREDCWSLNTAQDKGEKEKVNVN